MKRVTLVYGSGSGFSGQRFASELLAAGLRQRGWQVRLVKTPLLDRVGEHRGLAASFQVLGLTPFLLSAWAKALWAVFEPGVTVVNLGQTKFALLRDGLPLLVKGVCAPHGRIVVTLHGSLFMNWDGGSWEARLLRWIVKAASYVTVLGPTQKAQLVRLGVPANSVVLMDNTCLLLPLGEQDCVHKQEIAESEPIKVLYLSSLIETKGYPEFVEAIHELAYTVSFGVAATLCGPITLTGSNGRFGSHQAAQTWLEGELAEINRSQQVRLCWIHGAVGEAKAALLQDAHIFVLPSRYKVEAQPIALLEALASGCAVIATKVGEIPTTVSDATALLLDEATPTAIAAGITELRNNADRRQRMALNGLGLFKERFAYPQHLDRWEEMLSLLSNGPGH